MSHNILECDLWLLALLSCTGLGNDVVYFCLNETATQLFATCEIRAQA